MLNPPYFILLVTLVAGGGRDLDGGTASRSSRPSDAGTTAPPSVHAKPDASTVALPLALTGLDAGAPVRASSAGELIAWPEGLQPMPVLDGPAVLAAHAVLQEVLARFPKEYAGACAYSAKAMEVIVGQEAGLYFVRVNRRVDRCGWAAPGSNLQLDWFELYVVSPDGRVLARYPYHP